jgi:hypothetical protein
MDGRGLLPQVVRLAAAGGVACCRRWCGLLPQVTSPWVLNQIHDRIPHHLSASIHVPIGVSNNLDIQAKLKIT